MTLYFDDLQRLICMECISGHENLSPVISACIVLEGTCLTLQENADYSRPWRPSLERVPLRRRLAATSSTSRPDMS